ncbi:HCP-like protein [Aspergillus campestris IBT 28561]|uniref:HCP-like protein n=1 Tax=Aspergillus campestris (strain IBT 28561) TaxID=1392248 RepID=A0A2I1DB14_ASPC2|nr:HCP-like protein [Aspergillus campestris IBT 28561]PKY07064.1 HCP-like protein [Aspergillus campestris IBT 28561]
MPLRDILQKKERLGVPDSGQDARGIPTASVNPVPDITFVRSDTTTHEVIISPTVAHHAEPPSSPRRSFNPFHRSSPPNEPLSPETPSTTRPRRLSQLLRLDRPSSRNRAPSVHIPSDLPQISSDAGSEQDREALWEKRATMLAQGNPQLGLSPGSSRSRSSSHSGVDAEGDVNIQEAIRLHEAGELEKSTEMFRKLADPYGANNSLSQVLYGLALRHGWGCPEDPERAITYLSAAATNSATVESQALQAGMKKGGIAKGELVLAIFELGNCFRNGWGVQKDPMAARQYFETAANLGDTDAMNEVAWCYLEGFGGKKDRFAAAKYYRLAEQKGSKLVGNSWYV